MAMTLCVGSIALILFLSGCVSLGVSGADVARELSQLRRASIREGMLVPSSPASAADYKAQLSTYKSKAANVNDAYKAGLQAYVNGSLALLAQDEYARATAEAIRQIDPSLPLCGNGTPSTRALENIAHAKEEAQNAQSYFSIVEKDSALSNALGADYIDAVQKTLSPSIAAYDELKEKVETNCIVS